MTIFGPAARNTSSTSYISVLDPLITDFDPLEPGFRIANWARDYDSSGPESLRNKDGSLPVYLRAVASSDAGVNNDDATVKVQSGLDSWMELTIPGVAAHPTPWSGDGFVCYEAQGHLRCGVSPEDPTQAQIFIKADAAGEIKLYSLSLHFGFLTPNP